MNMYSTVVQAMNFTPPPIPEVDPAQEYGSVKFTQVHCTDFFVLLRPPYFVEIDACAVHKVFSPSEIRIFVSLSLPASVKLDDTVVICCWQLVAQFALIHVSFVPDNAV